MGDATVQLLLREIRAGGTGPVERQHFEADLKVRRSVRSVRDAA